MNFSERLKKARTHAGLTQRYVAEAVGMSQPGYQKLERKASGSKFAAQIAAVCGVNPEWLTTGKGEMIAGAMAQANDGARSLSPKQRALLGIFDRLTSSQQDAFIRELEDVKRKNEEIIEELGCKSKLVGNNS